MAIGFDHVCGTFKNNYRSVNNFISSNVIVMDCDNEGPEEDWITPETMADKLHWIFVVYKRCCKLSRCCIILKRGVQL